MKFIHKRKMWHVIIEFDKYNKVVLVEKEKRIFTNVSDNT